MMDAKSLTRLIFAILSAPLPGFPTVFRADIIIMPAGDFLGVVTSVLALEACRAVGAMMGKSYATRR